MKKKNAMGAHDVAGRVTGQHIPAGINKFWVHGLLFFTPRPVVVGTWKKKNDGKIRGVKKEKKKIATVPVKTPIYF